MDKRFYDLLVIFHPQEKREKAISEITNIIKNGDGAIEKIDEWGIKTLSYPIKKETSGFYLLIRFQVKPSCIFELLKALKTEEAILRYAVIKRKKPLLEEEKKGGENEEEVKT